MVFSGQKSINWRKSAELSSALIFAMTHARFFFSIFKSALSTSPKPEKFISYGNGSNGNLKYFMKKILDKVWVASLTYLKYHNPFCAIALK